MRQTSAQQDMWKLLKVKLRQGYTCSDHRGVTCAFNEDSVGIIVRNT